jgi:hypothetical protein
LHLLLPGIEREGDEVLVRHPEMLIEALFEFLRAAKQPARLFFLVHPPENFGELESGGVGKALLLAGGDGRFYGTAIGIDHRARRVLPPLMRIALLRAGAIVDKAIVIEVAIAVY